MNKIKEVFTDEEKRGILLLVISGISLILSFFELVHWPFDAAWISIVLCGAPILKDAGVGLFTRFDIKADVLVAIALIASVCIGEIFAAGEVAFIMAIGSLLEERTVKKARSGIEKLVNLTPQSARVLREGREEEIPAGQVKQGDVLRVLAGETVPADGVIMAGQTSIDQAVMTGESLPVDKNIGDEVMGGTVNQFGTFDMQATKAGEDSSLQRMIRLVQSADADKAKIVGIADRWATWIVVIAIVSAVLTGIISGEVIRAVTILVVFCPCALVLATPTAIMAGIGNVTKFGTLVREGDALERMAGVSRIVFDKTGTLTHGRPEVAEILALDGTREDLLYMVARAEKQSEHPLGKAIVRYYNKQYGQVLHDPQRFELIAGCGVTAELDGGLVLAGNENLLSDHGIHVPDALAGQTEQYKNEGCTAVYIARAGQVKGAVVLSDTLRSDAKQTVQQIQALGVNCTLLTGDNENAACHMAGLCGIAEVRHSCLPEDKVRIIKEYGEAGDKVCMIGDGINDAPALKTAYLGMAMGGIGSDIAIEAADMVLVGDDIKNIPHLLLLSRRMMRTIKQNLSFSMILNFAAIFLAMAGILDPVLGALVHNAGSVLVIINSAMLLKWRAKKDKNIVQEKAQANIA